MPPSQRLLVLDAEVFEATSVLGHGLAILRDHEFGINDGPAVLTLLALGVEKSCKMTVGLIAEADGRGWPTKDTMRRWGHDIPKLERATRDALRERIDMASAPGFVSQGLKALDDDPTLAEILRALGRYASRARFYNLDHLAQSPQPDAAPQHVWDSARDAVATRLGLWEELTDVRARQAKLQMNAAMVASVQGWWDWYRLCWVQGLCGEEARALGRPLA